VGCALIFLFSLVQHQRSSDQRHYPISLSLLASALDRPAGVQNFRFIVLKRKDHHKDESSSFLSSLLENLIFLSFSAAIVIWCTRKQYISFTGRHKKIDRDYNV